MKEKHYSVDLINSEYWVNVYIGSDYKKFKKHIEFHFQTKKVPQMEGLENFRGKIWFKPQYAPFIFVNTNNLKGYVDVLATLAHEACHAMQHTFEVIGEEESREVFAHSVSAIIKGYK